MEATDVPVGNLIDFDSEPPASVPAESPPLPPQPSSGNGLLEDLGDPAAVGEESDTTESADSENDMGDSPSHHSWNNYRRSSSIESFSSNQSTESAKDEVMVERREFMRQYVEKIFSGGEDLDQEEKAKFGELCSGENGKGREWFARYVSAQRCNSKCVSEQTFYRLVQSFAVVLFECHQMDDFGPAKNLMTMCFTYYHIGGLWRWISLGVEQWFANCSVDHQQPREERASVQKRFGRPRAVPHFQPVKEGEDKPKEKLRKTVSLYSPEEEEEEKKGEKIYLYMHLKQQPIWHTLRFWNAAFFDAVHCERRKRSPTTREKWCHMTQEERDDSLRFNENITFGQLG
ncbi:hypothetical protein UY3_06582, partial [Chelonia mydas]